MPKKRIKEKQDEHKITVHRVTPIRQKEEVLALAVVECGSWIVRSLKLMRGEDGTTWIRMPEVADAHGHALETCDLSTKADKSQLHDAVLDAYIKTMKDIRRRLPDGPPEELPF